MWTQGYHTEDRNWCPGQSLTPIIYSVQKKENPTLRCGACLGVIMTAENSEAVGCDHNSSAPFASGSCQREHFNPAYLVAITCYRIPFPASSQMIRLDFHSTWRRNKQTQNIHVLVLQLHKRPSGVLKFAGKLHDFDWTASMSLF